jgi:hypothetical protein
MVTANSFAELVRTSFSYLETQYGYTFEDVASLPRELQVKYRKDDIMVYVKYSYANKYIEVSIYTHVSKVDPGKFDWHYGLMLMLLVHKLNPEIDYESIMPSHISIEESTSKVASLLKYYGETILTGQEWISNGEISGYNPPVPSELP